MEYNGFKHILAEVSEAYSVRDKTKYVNISIKNDEVLFRRGSKSYESISIRELYEVFTKCSFINTTILRKYISDRTFSPSLAILIKSGLYDPNGNRVSIDQEIVDDNIIFTEESSVVISEVYDEIDVAEKDEGRFFAALANLLDSKHIKAKSLLKPVNTVDLVLNKNHVNMGLNEAVENQMKVLLQNLNSNGNVGTGGLERFVDGMIVKHPLLGTRIVEFDEEQHFTPARLDSLQILKEIEEMPFVDLYIDLCKHNIYLNQFVLPKHRVKNNYEDEITDFKKFQEWLEKITPSGKNNGYIAPKPGFGFVGGRMAQRAYYDSLRDIAHLAFANQPNLLPIIRFPKVFVNLTLKKDFDEASMSELQKAIAEYLLEYYNYNVN